jgi:protein SCO1
VAGRLSTNSLSVVWLPLPKTPSRIARPLGACLMASGVLIAGVWLGHRLDPTRSTSHAPLDLRSCGGFQAEPASPRLGPFVGVDQASAPLSDGDLRGHVWIADFIFTRCRGLCPLLSARLSALRAQLKDERTRFVSFTIDPEHDTPHALANYARHWGPDDPRWRLLRTSRATLSRLADSLDPAAAGWLDLSTHSDRFFLIDGAGRVRGSFASGDSHEMECLLETTRELTDWGG